MKKYIIFVLSFVTIINSGCRKTENFPIEPVITYESSVVNRDVSGKDSTITLVFSFTDGDGDIGLKQNETAAPFTGEFYYNLVMTYQEKVNGVFIPKLLPIQKDSITPSGDTIQIVIYEPLRFRYRMPFIESSGRIKAIKGTVSTEINTLGFSPSSRFEFFIYDRALHKSNVEFSSEIIIP